MKRVLKIVLLINVVMLIGLITAQAQDFSNPGQYNDFIVGEQVKIMQKNINYISKSVHSSNDRKIEAKRQAVIKQINKSLDLIKKMPAIDDQTKLRDEAIGVFEMYLAAYDVDFKEANELEANSQNSYEALEAYYKAQDKAEKKLDNATQRFSKAQESFAKKYNMTLIENKEQETNLFTKVANLNEYNRKVYLAYFRASKANSAYWDAVNARKPGDMEKKRKSILEKSEKALLELQEIGGFEGDKVYRDKTLATVRFFKSQATKPYKDMVEVTKKQKDNSLTQADANNANKIINYYNKQVQKLVNEMNDANAQLLQKNIPKTE